MTGPARLYRTMGLTVRSAIDLQWLPEGRGAVDCEIAEGSVPERLEGGAALAALTQTADESLLLTVPGVARILVEGGRRIRVAADPAVEAGAVQALLMGPALCAALHRSGRLPLHGAAVETPGGAALLLGTTRAGKSVVAAALARLGARVLADDTAAVVLGPDGPRVEPEAPYLRLWEDAVGDAVVLGPVRESLAKQCVALGDRHQAESRPVERVYAMERRPAGPIAIELFRGAEGVRRLLAHVRHGRMPGPVAAAERLAACGALGARAGVRALGHPAGAPPEAIAEAILRDAGA